MSSPREANGLEPKHEEAIVALLEQPTIKKAAEHCGMAFRTLYRWLDNPTFKEAYRKARRETFKHAISMTQRYAPLAVQTLAKIMTDDKATSASRAAAAEGILKFSRDSINLDDLEGRIEELESAARAAAERTTPTPPPPSLTSLDDDVKEGA